MDDEIELAEEIDNLSDAGELAELYEPSGTGFVLRPEAREALAEVKAALKGMTEGLEDQKDQVAGLRERVEEVSVRLAIRQALFAAGVKPEQVGAAIVEIKGSFGWIVHESGNADDDYTVSAVGEFGAIPLELAVGHWLAGNAAEYQPKPATHHPGQYLSAIKRLH